LLGIAPIDFIGKYIKTPSWARANNIKKKIDAFLEYYKALGRLTKRLDVTATSLINRS
jgi:hypothetical protein